MPEPLYQQVTANLGIVRMASLQRWADHTAAALGCTVRLYGSALKRKDWRDLDIALQWDMPTLNRGGGAWLWLCHAASVAASQEVGAPVEVHWHTDPMRAHHLVLAQPKASEPMPDFPCHREDEHGAHLHPVGKTDVERRCPGVPAKARPEAGEQRG